MHSRAIFQLLLSVILNAHIFTVSGTFSSSITKECPTLAHNQPLSHGRPFMTNKRVVLKNGNQPKIFQSEGPSTRAIFPAIRTGEERAKSLSQGSNPKKPGLALTKNDKLACKIPAPSERIKQTTITKRCLGSSHKTLDPDLVVEAYRQSTGTRLIISDYDGTLREFVNDPKAATPSQQVLDDLEALSSEENNLVWLVSGRDQGFLQKHFGHIENLGLKAAYGAATRDPNSGEWEEKDFDRGSLDTIMEIMEGWRSSLPTTWIEEKDFGLAYHYKESYDVALEDRSEDLPRKQAKDEIDRLYNSRAKQLKDQLDDAIAEEGLPLKTILGNMVVEVKDKTLSKREAVLSIYKNIEHPDFVLIGGDDPADEDMFQVAHEQESKAKRYGNSPFVATVHVSHDKGKRTDAKYMVRVPHEFRGLLSKLSASG